MRLIVLAVVSAILPFIPISARLEILPVSGGEVQKLVAAALYATPTPVVEKAPEMLK